MLGNKIIRVNHVNLLLMVGEEKAGDIAPSPVQA